jgi:hypothetical protein
MAEEEGYTSISDFISHLIREYEARKKLAMMRTNLEVNDQSLPPTVPNGRK